MPEPQDPSSDPGGQSPAIPTSAPTPAPEPAPSPEFIPPSPGATEAPPDAGDVENVSFRDEFGKRGFDLSQFPDDETLMNFVVSQMQQAQQIPQLQQFAQFGQQVAPHYDQFQEFLKAQQAPAPAAAEAEPEPYWEAPPEWNPQWEQFLSVDQDQTSPTFGKIVASAGARPDLVQRYHEYQEWRKGREEILFRDPYAAIEPRFKTELERFKEDLLNTVREDRASDWAERQQQQAINSLVVANESWLYQHDANGQSLVNPQTGQPALSQEGQVFSGLVQQCEAMGMTDPHHAWQAAMQMLPGTLAQMGLLKPAAGADGAPAAPAQPPTKPLSPRQLANQGFVSRALAHQPNRGQTVMSAAQPHGPTQNAFASFDEIAAEQAAQVGIDVK